MPDRLIKVVVSASGNKAKDRGDLLLQQAERIPWWAFAALIFIGIGLLSACGGSPGKQMIAAQTLAQVKAPDPNVELQQQLMSQTSKASLVSYKDYQVGPEDVLTIDIYGQDKMNRTVRVNGQGEITLPLVDVVKVAGLTPQEIEKRLKELYDAKFLVNPQITVGVKEVIHQRVAVTGAVTKPGTYEIIGPRTLLEVVAQAGGFANGPVPAGDLIYVTRHQNAADLTKTLKAGVPKPSDKKETLVIDQRRLVSGQAPALNITVRNGDIIHVPFAGTAYVLGGVKKPGSVAVRENLTVSQAVALAGGVDPILGTNNISIMRLDEKNKPINIDTNLNRIVNRDDPDYPINANDVVVVYESTIKKTLYVLRTLLPIPTPSTAF